MRIQSITPVGRLPVYDLSVEEVEHYVLKNGVVTHNTGIMYSANQVFIIGKSQEKDGKDLEGFKFTINIEKSRYVKEKSKLPFTVLFDTGIQKWSSLMELALESGHLTSKTQGWYNEINVNTGEVMEPKRRAKDIEKDDDFFERLIVCPKFNEYVERKFKLNASVMGDNNAREDDTIESDSE